MKSKFFMVFCTLMLFTIFLLTISACRKSAPETEQPSSPRISSPDHPSPSIPPQNDLSIDPYDYALDGEDAPPIIYRHQEGTDLNVIFCHDIIEEVGMPISPSKEFSEGQNFYFFISSKENFNIDTLSVLIAIIDPETSEALLYDQADISVNPRSDITFFPFSLPEGFYVVIVQQGDIAEARSELIIHATD